MSIHIPLPNTAPGEGEARKITFHPASREQIHGMAIASPRQELPGKVITPHSWSCRSRMMREGVCYDALENHHKSALTIVVQRHFFCCLVLQKESDQNLCPMPVATILSSNSVVQS